MDKYQDIAGILLSNPEGAELFSGTISAWITIKLILL